MKRKTFLRGMASVLCAGLLAVSMAGCSGSGTGTGDSDVIKLKMAVADADTSAQAEGARAIASEVEQATNGRVQIEVMAGGTLGAERDTVELAMLGGVDIVTCANSVLTQWIPEMAILDQAYLFTNEEQAHAAVDGPVGDLIEREALEKLNLHVVGYMESGFRNVFSKDPITSIEDFKGVKIRTMQNSYHMAAFESFGAIPTSMAASEQFTAVQLVPVLWPIASSLGVDVIHFGMIVCISNVVGTMTPPVAVNIFSAASVSKLKMGEIVKGAIPFFIGYLAVFFAVVLIPQLSTFLL